MRLRSVVIPMFLAVTCLPAWAQQNTYRVGDWVVSKYSKVQLATVRLRGGTATTGIICFLESKKCIAYIYTGNSCDIGQIVPMMINSAAGAFPITTDCEAMPGYPSKFISVINQFDSVKEAFISGGRVGFVEPLANGDYRALRFSTNGAIPAISDAMALPAKATHARSGNDRVF